VSPNRTVIEEEPYFRRELLAIESDPIKADELIDGAKWVLSRNPSLGQQKSPHSPLWYFLIVAGALRCVLYYTFDTKEVLLVSIERRS
jgi:hypothetical protein